MEGRILVKDPEEIFQSQVQDLRLVIGLGHMARGFAQSAERSTSVKPRVVVRCPHPHGREVARVFETPEGPLYFAMIPAVSADRRGPDRPLWEQLDRLLRLPPEVVDDDLSLFEAFNSTRVKKNPPVMVNDPAPRLPKPVAYSVLMKPNALTRLWWRCSDHWTPEQPYASLDPAALGAVFDRAVTDDRWRRVFLPPASDGVV
ncbi:hypothetical protein [Nocardioides sp.]|uniref:hypothetical protein n=1 Tax=Nocardioides sp. TaxID=35761 RepID=UPI003783651E